MKIIVKRIIDKLGFKLSKKLGQSLLNEDPLQATSNLIGKNPILFDVGVNQGQTIEKMLKVFPNSKIYGFEPSKQCFDIVKKKIKNSNVIIQNAAIGAEKTKLEFNEYSWSALNSLLKRAYGNSKIIDSYEVDVITISDFCESEKIPYINFLKTDTEGYELNVLKGAYQMMSENKVQFILVEIFFNENYIGQSSFGDIYNYLIQNNFQLVRFYEMLYTSDGIASKTDALFLNAKFDDKLNN